MGIIYQASLRAERGFDCSPLEDTFISIVNFFEFLVVYSDDTRLTVVNYLLASDFCYLDYYTYDMNKNLEKHTFEDFKDNENKVAIFSYPIISYLERVSGECDPYKYCDYYLKKMDIIKVKELIKIGIDKKEYLDDELNLPNYPLEDAQTRISELERELAEYKKSKTEARTIPFEKRIDCTDKKLTQSEQLEQSYQIYSNDFSFHEDKYPVNTPEEMILRIQGLLKVIGKRDKQITELKQKLEQIETTNNQDIELSTRSQNLAAKIILALLDIAELDKDSPPYQYDDLSSNNRLIYDQMQANGINVSQQKIGDWLDLAVKQVKDK